MREFQEFRGGKQKKEDRTQESECFAANTDTDTDTDTALNPDLSAVALAQAEPPNSVTIVLFVRVLYSPLFASDKMILGREKVEPVSKIEKKHRTVSTVSTEV
jgi:hypothetical protein